MLMTTKNWLVPWGTSEQHWSSYWRYRSMNYPRWTGGWMHLSQYAPTWEVSHEWYCHWVVGQFTGHLQNRIKYKRLNWGWVGRVGWCKCCTTSGSVDKTIFGWTRFQDTDPVIYQENQSAIFLEKHGRGSIGKWSCHIDVRYYFVKDPIALKEVIVKYCPSGDMLTDYFTKPLQGGLFVKFHDMIMNSHSDPPWYSAM